jgi:3D (Asp-Asp-Asp) domain-containing protein
MLVDYRLARFALIISALGLLCAGVASTGFAADLRIAKADGLGSASVSAAPASRSTVALAVVERLQAIGKADPAHPLRRIVEKEAQGLFGAQPKWRLPLLINGLCQSPRAARMTAFSSNCPDGGGSRTRWGTRVRRGICAADPRYWGPGTVIWVDKPVEQILVVEDTGSAIQGRDRFDICFGTDAAQCSRFGVQRLVYYTLHKVAPKGSWGTRPRSWQPPSFSLTEMLQDLTAKQAAG